MAREPSCFPYHKIFGIPSNEIKIKKVTRIDDKSDQFHEDIDNISIHS
jgi:hypothetical protein